jgi:hypothetical protein
MLHKKFIDLLLRANVQTGKALQHAESIYKGRLRKKTIEGGYWELTESGIKT